MSEPSTSRFYSRGAPRPDTLAWAWTLLLATSRHARAGAPHSGHFALEGDELAAVSPATPAGVLERRGDGAWVALGHLPAELVALLDLYLPICSCAPLTIGHLGQSIDGYVATRSGDSSYVNGPENIVHLHRLRALCDAVVVGAGTIAADDPRLTTRLVPGANPVRVVLDPSLRLAGDRRVFTDGEAETLVACSAEAATERSRGKSRKLGRAEIVGVPAVGSALDLSALVDALHARGLKRIFVEGGGTTVSRFLEAGLLDRLQIAIAPLIMGSGRPGLTLPSTERIAECLRPAHRVFAMGGDVLFDCDLRAPAPAVDRNDNAPVARIY